MVEVFVCHVEKEVLWEVAKSLDKGKDSDSRKSYHSGIAQVKKETRNAG